MQLRYSCLEILSGKWSMNVHKRLTAESAVSFFDSQPSDGCFYCDEVVLCGDQLDGNWTMGDAEVLKVQLAELIAIH